MADTPVAHQFSNAAQQREAATLGMWTFLTTEVLFFGGLFTGYTIYRAKFPAAFADAGHHLYMSLGAVNTAILLTSSWTMALAIHHSHESGEAAGRSVKRYLLATAGLGFAFLAVKAVEYFLDFREGLLPGAHFAASRFSDAPHAQMFFVLYFVMTALHAVHMIVGIGVVLGMTLLVSAAQSPSRWSNALEMSGLYWHFVDIVWIFLFPLLYLAA